MHIADVRIFALDIAQELHQAKCIDDLSRLVGDDLRRVDIIKHAEEFFNFTEHHDDSLVKALLR